jgi:hypothetical protein
MKGFLQGLKFPFKLLAGWLRKRKKIRDERKEKQIKHVRNFDSTRLKNVSYQVRAGRKLSEGQKKWRRRKFSKKTNNSKG